jgi:hypothetical protein
MIRTDTMRRLSGGLRENPAQAAAVALCSLFGVAMIANNQLQGEAMWFWYASYFHQGVKLYANLHTPLQPLYVLLADAWIQMFGHKALVTELPSVLQAVLLAVGLWLVVRESNWPDWQKGVVIGTAFLLTVLANSYRFDDYHVLAENFILYSLFLLLLLARKETAKQQFLLAAGVGVFSGLTITTRVTDGAALLCVNVFVLLILPKKRKPLLALLCIFVASATVLTVVRLTGDTFSSYVNSTLFHAAASKGGTGSILTAPFLFLKNALVVLRASSKTILAWLIALTILGALLDRYRHWSVRSIVLLQLAVGALTFAFNTASKRDMLMTGGFERAVALVLALALYPLGLLALARFLLSCRDRGKREWDAREILLLVPLAEWASYSAGAAAQVRSGYYYFPLAILMLLVPVLQPFRKWVWVRASTMAIMSLLLVTCIVWKVGDPYSWQNYKTSPMFAHRVWFHHPVYGPLYINRDLLQFSVAACADMGETEIAQGKLGTSRPVLLAMPYSYPNYFCDTPPWHGYVQTFFDTSARGTIDQMMAELNADPPQWIVYQRQMNILEGAEKFYNHGQPLAQRDLDTMIFQKIASGQWRLVDRSNYLTTDDPAGKGWFIIQTHP